MVAGPGFPLLGISDTARRIQSQIARVAQTETPLLIEGETGTGKNRVARAVHAASRRSTGPFSALDCGSVPPSLFSRELFGHVRGAFTGAETDQPGRLAVASGGTFVLEGLPHLDRSNQAALLGVLDRKEYLPIGSSSPEQVDLRFVQTSQEPLYECLEKGLVREDLFYRVSGLSVRIPPLRERRDDLEFFLDFLMRSEAAALRRNAPRLSRELRRTFLGYSWPGNLSELRHTLRGLLSVTEADSLGLEELPPEQRDRFRSAPSDSRNRTFSLPADLSFHRQVEVFQKTLLQRTWGECGDRRELCRRLQLAPYQLKYLLRKLHLELSVD